MEIIRKAFMEGYATSDINLVTMFCCLLLTALLGIYIYLLYKNINKNSFYNKNFNLSLITIAIITAAIILTIQSNIVVSLGMVGALSIVRFRTAIKDPMDLVFLFWAISIGIICGAGFALIAIVASIILTIVVVVFSIIPEVAAAELLVVNADSFELEEEVKDIVADLCQYSKVRARNVTKTSLNMAIEVRVKEPQVLIEELMRVEGIQSASLVECDGDITA